MIAFRFLQLSDLHLDSNLQAGRLGFPAEKARVRRLELQELLIKACRLLRERNLDAMLIPGDLFDDESVSQDTVNFVIDQFKRLAPAPVVISPGNHDFYSLGSPYNDGSLAARRQQSWPDNVHIFKEASWSTRPLLPSVHITAMAHCASAPRSERLLALRVPRSGPLSDIHLLLFHGSRDNIKIPKTKFRTLPFSDPELVSQEFDYVALGHYHEQSEVRAADGRIIAAYSGCPAGRGLDETGEKSVLVGEISKDGSRSHVALEAVRLDHRIIRRLETECTGATHRAALLERVDAAISRSGAAVDDLLYIRLSGRVPPGIDTRSLAASLEDRFFHVAIDTAGLKPDYDLSRYEDRSLRTAEARFAREMVRRIGLEDDPARRRTLENALYYGLDALLQGEVAPRYED